MNSNYDLRKMQLHLLEMLKKIDVFCKENNIKYTLDGGTALGAYRHKGFIPWDDDLDIAMDIEDYKLFCRLFNENPPKGLFLQYCDSELNYLNGFAKIRDLTTITEESGVSTDYIHKGLFIDVFPLENVSKSLSIISHLLHRPLFAVSKYCELKNGSLSQRFVHFLYKMVECIDKFFRIICRKILRPNLYSYSYGCNIYPHKNMLNKKIFDGERTELFEGSRFPVPYCLELYLTIRYGDFMTLPPEDKRYSKHLKSISYLESIE